jgi:hypothetical protein
MRQRTKLPIPKPTADQFKNFDRLARILISKTHKPKMATGEEKKERQRKERQRRRRLPRP